MQLPNLFKQTVSQHWPNTTEACADIDSWPNSGETAVTELVT